MNVSYFYYVLGTIYIKHLHLHQSSERVLFFCFYQMLFLWIKLSRTPIIPAAHMLAAGQLK